MLILIHSGQTGVERGAQRAAVTCGIAVAGFSTTDGRDELGRLAPNVARALTPCFERGPRPAMEANLAIATALVLVVPDARLLRSYAGMEAVARSARARNVPHAIVDPTTDRERLLEWIRALPETSGSVRLFITGPRSTRWLEGERLSWQLVAALRRDDALTVPTSTDRTSPTV